MFGDPRLPERFWSKVKRSMDGCWWWTAGKTGRGYGAFHVGGRTLGAHRVVYRALVDDNADTALDHLCRNRSCVNPAHLEVVTVGENVLRGESFSAVNARKDVCDRGHALTGDNLYIKPSGRRVCRECRRLTQAPWVAAKRRGLDTALSPGLPGKGE